jgi:hypothetical protein
MNRKRNALSSKSRSERAIRIRTKFSDLLKVMKGEARAGEERLIAEIVYHWIESGRLKFVPPGDGKAVAHPTFSTRRREGRIGQPVIEITI